MQVWSRFSNLGLVSNFKTWEVWALVSFLSSLQRNFHKRTNGTWLETCQLCLNEQKLSFCLRSSVTKPSRKMKRPKNTTGCRQKIRLGSELQPGNWLDICQTPPSNHLAPYCFGIKLIEGQWHLVFQKGYIHIHADPGFFVSGFQDQDWMAPKFGNALFARC